MVSRRQRIAGCEGRIGFIKLDFIDSAVVSLQHREGPERDPLARLPLVLDVDLKTAVEGVGQLQRPLLSCLEMTASMASCILWSPQQQDLMRNCPVSPGRPSWYIREGTRTAGPAPALRTRARLWLCLYTWCRSMYSMPSSMVRWTPADLSPGGISGEGLQGLDRAHVAGVPSPAHLVLVVGPARGGGRSPRHRTSGRW